MKIRPLKMKYSVVSYKKWFKPVQKFIDWCIKNKEIILKECRRKNK